MNSFIRLSAERRRLLCEEGFQRLGLVPASIEKDFWVCWTLRELFGLPEWGPHLTFKGGTSLSKGWQLISRFSEDIDVVIDREFLGFGGELSRNKRKQLIAECSRRIRATLLPDLERRCREVLSTDLKWELVPDAEDPDDQTLLFRYPSVFEGSIAYIRPVVKIEMGARSEPEPVESPSIQPYLAKAFPDVMPDSLCSIQTVVARRTFWEKAMLLHEANFLPPDKKLPPRLSRHYYDLWCLIGHGIAREAMGDLDLFDRAARHREIFFKRTGVDYGTLRKGTLQVSPREERLGGWRKDYEAMRSEMFFEEPPSFAEVLMAIRGFEDDFNRS
ncbi:MAG TPA: nucleotidyl transferase AbiEii/AbiGii toxin family protein [Candidatus Deferrimicrobiaceae bacterium]|jgi:hypothetical protein